MTQDARLIDSAEIEEIQSRLEALDNDDAMDAGVLDGYLTAQAVNPLKPEEEDVIPFIFSSEGDPESVPDDSRLIELIRMRGREIRAALNAGGGLDPVIFPIVDENGKEILDGDGLEALIPWTSGFMMGATQWPEEVQQDDEVQRTLAPIAAYMAAEGEELEDDVRQQWEEARAAVKTAGNLEDALYQVVESAFALKELLVPNQPERRETPRIGRNDPCPCGSGKKYKQCCGRKN